MKAILLVIALGLSGCAAHQPVVAPIPGQVNTIDGQVYRGLRDMQAAIDVYKAKVADGTCHPTPAMTSEMADLIALYNDTHTAWETYHNASSSTQAATGATLQALYQHLQDKYQSALSNGAPLAPAGAN